VWLAARRLNAGRFVWPHQGRGTLTITRAQFDALVLGLPWQRIGEAGINHGAVNQRTHGCASPRDAAPTHSVISIDSLDTFEVQQLRHTVLELQTRLRHATALNEKLTHEMAMLKPGHGKTHRAHLWSYCTTRFNPVQAVVFDLTESRGGQHVPEFLGLPGRADRPPWRGRLVTDDFSGYKACFELGVTEVGCWAHARRKFHERWANHGSTVAVQALTFFAGARGTSWPRCERFAVRAASCRSGTAISGTCPKFCV